MHTSSPAAEASGPPLTPQSTTVTPRAAPSARIASTVSVAMVLTMTAVLPGAAPANTPSGPCSTARTWASLKTTTRITSLRAASSEGVAATWAPSRNGAVASSRTSDTVTGMPARMREVARPPPMSPSPMTPTRNAEAVPSSWFSGTWPTSRRRPCDGGP